MFPPSKTTSHLTLGSIEYYRYAWFLDDYFGHKTSFSNDFSTKHFRIVHQVEHTLYRLGQHKTACIQSLSISYDSLPFFVNCSSGLIASNRAMWFWEKTNYKFEWKWLLGHYTFLKSWERNLYTVLPCPFLVPIGSV